MESNTKIGEFIAFCIEMYAQRHAKSGGDTVLLFDRHGILELLEKHYEVLHTQSLDYVIGDIEAKIEREEALR